MNFGGRPSTPQRSRVRRKKEAHVVRQHGVRVEHDAVLEGARDVHDQAGAGSGVAARLRDDLAVSDDDRAKRARLRARLPEWDGTERAAVDEVAFLLAAQAGRLLYPLGDVVRVVRILPGAAVRGGRCRRRARWRRDRRRRRPPAVRSASR